MTCPSTQAWRPPIFTIICSMIVTMTSVGCWAHPSASSNAARDPVAHLIELLGQRGIDMDAELAQLNALAHLRHRPAKSRTMYMTVKASLQTKLARVQSVPLPEPDNTLIARLAAGGLRIMAVTAHPDDENMMSGLLALARDYDNRVLLLCLTRGEAGERFTERQQGEDLGHQRERELRAAAALLDVDVMIAGFPNGAFKDRFPRRTFWFPDDVLISWRTMEDPVHTVQRFATRFKPDIVVTIEPNWGWTGNPEHRAAARLARYAATHVGAQLVYAVMAATVHTDRFDLTRFSPWRGQRYWAVKLAAARQHRSQYRLPAQAEHDPERFPNLAVEHYQRVDSP